jgi:hypothetical protein
VISPAGFEDYFRELAPLLNAGGPPDEEALKELQGRYGLDMDLGSAPVLAQEHGLVAAP